MINILGISWQIVRFQNGLKSGAYIRVLVAGRPASILKTRAEKAIEMGEDIKIISETDYQQALKPKPKEEPKND